MAPTVPIIIIGFLIFYSASNINLKIYSLLVTCTALTQLFFFILVTFLGDLNFKKGFLNFFIGDEGGYSLSRVQAVLWAIIIISYQLALIFTLIDSPLENALRLYQLIFSESSLWLLGLSLSSYIVVKGITVDKIKKQPNLYKVKQPKLSDILVGENGLDFSRCQMLVWTLIGVFVFVSKCYFFIYELEKAHDAQNISMLFQNVYDEYKKTELDSLAYVPYLPLKAPL